MRTASSGIVACSWTVWWGTWCQVCCARSNPRWESSRACWSLVHGFLTCQVALAPAPAQYMSDAESADSLACQSKPPPLLMLVIVIVCRTPDAGHEEVRLTTNEILMEDINHPGVLDIVPYTAPRPSSPAEALVYWLQVCPGLVSPWSLPPCTCPGKLVIGPHCSVHAFVICLAPEKHNGIS